MPGSGFPYISKDLNTTCNGSWRAVAIFFIVLSIAMASTLAFVIGNKFFLYISATKFNPNGGGFDCAHTFLDGYFYMKKGIQRSQISWLFLIIYYELSENLKRKLVFHRVLG